MQFGAGYRQFGQEASHRVTQDKPSRPSRMPSRLLGILLGRISHIAVWGMSPIAYGAAYATGAAGDIAGATRPPS